MRRTAAQRGFFVLFGVLALCGWGAAQQGPAMDAPSSPLSPSPGPPSGKPSELPRAEIREGEGTIQLGEVTIDPRKREVSIPCFVNMREGLLEYALVGDTGKRHESLLATSVEPYNLQVALLLLGLKGGKSLDGQGDPLRPEGDPVQLTVEWKEGAETKRGRLESLITVRRSGANEARPMAETDWVFTGSKVLDGVFMAQAERSIVAVFRDSAAMIDNPAPEGVDDTAWFANSKVMPAVGTPMTLVIRAAK